MNFPIYSVGWLVGVMLAPVLIYFFIIRPKSSITQTADDIAVTSPNVGPFSVLAELASRFRSLVIGFLGIVITVAPDLLQILAGIDYQRVLPAPWAIFAGPTVSILLILVRATATTPPSEPSSKEA